MICDEVLCGVVAVVSVVKERVDDVVNVGVNDVAVVPAEVVSEEV